MKSFTYERAANTESAVAEARGAGTKFIAGGTNLLDLMKLQIETPEKLVDITRLPLGEITPRDEGGVSIGWSPRLPPPVSTARQGWQR